MTRRFAIVAGAVLAVSLPVLAQSATPMGNEGTFESWGTGKSTAFSAEAAVARIGDGSKPAPGMLHAAAATRVFPSGG